MLGWSARNFSMEILATSSYLPAQSDHLSSIFSAGLGVGVISFSTTTCFSTSMTLGTSFSITFSTGTSLTTSFSTITGFSTGTSLTTSFSITTGVGAGAQAAKMAPVAATPEMRKKSLRFSFLLSICSSPYLLSGLSG